MIRIYKNADVNADADVYYICEAIFMLEAHQFNYLVELARLWHDH